MQDVSKSLSITKSREACCGGIQIDALPPGPAVTLGINAPRDADIRAADARACCSQRAKS